MIGHQHRRATGELDKLPKVEHGIISLGQRITLWSFAGNKEVASADGNVSPPARYVDDPDSVIDKFLDQVIVRLLHFFKRNERVVDSVCGVNLDTHVLRAAEDLGSGLGKFDQETASISDRATIVVGSLIGATDSKINRLC